MTGFSRKAARLAVGLALVPGSFLPGCSSSGAPQPRVVRVEVQTPVQVVRAQLEKYAAGESVDSERELFPTWVDNVRTSDPEMAEWLGKGFAEIESKPAQVRAIAGKMLERLPR